MTERKSGRRERANKEREIKTDKDHQGGRVKEDTGGKRNGTKIAEERKERKEKKWRKKVNTTHSTLTSPFSA